MNGLASSLVKRPSIDDANAFRRTMAFEKRAELSRKVRQRYPDRLPIILVCAGQASRRSGTPTANRSKLLVPPDYTMARVLLEVRHCMQPPLQPHQAIYLFVGQGVLVPTSALMSSIYERFKDDDGFLYLYYGGENTFG
jgi:GABA(A) receptor-associated protein